MCYEEVSLYLDYHYVCIKDWFEKPTYKNPKCYEAVESEIGWRRYEVGEQTPFSMMGLQDQ